MDRAVTFYRGVLGLPVSNRAGNEWAEFQAGPVRLALHAPRSPPCRRAGRSSSGWTSSMKPDGLCSNGAWCSTGTSPKPAGFARFATFHDHCGQPGPADRIPRPTLGIDSLALTFGAP